MPRRWPQLARHATSVAEMIDRYGHDVLAPGWQKTGQKTSKEVVVELGMIIEEPTSGFVGELVAWENGLVVLEDRKLKRRSFPVGGGYLVDGQPAILRIPPRAGASAKTTRTASGSRVSPTTKAKTALGSRIFVEGRHDAELIEKIWGDDLRHVGVVVEYLGGIDDLVGVVAEFQPVKGRRLGVLVDHLVAGSKEKRIADEVARSGYGEFVLVEGHEFIDIWQAIRPESLGFKAWPAVPRDEDFKKGTLARLGLPHQDQADIAKAWQAMLKRVKSHRDLDAKLVRTVELLIDFVTQDHLDSLEP